MKKAINKVISLFLVFLLFGFNFIGILAQFFASAIRLLDIGMIQSMFQIGFHLGDVLPTQFHTLLEPACLVIGAEPQHRYDATQQQH